jgi:large subunit ribosomal protein L4
VFDASVFDAPATKQAAALLADWGVAGSVLVVLAESEAAAGKSFRNLPRVSAMPVEDAGVADIVGAASLLVSEAALPALVARAGASARSGQEVAA